MYNNSYTLYNLNVYELLYKKILIENLKIYYVTESEK